MGKTRAVIGEFTTPEGIKVYVRASEVSGLSPGYQGATAITLKGGNKPFCAVVESSETIARKLRWK